MHEPFITGKLLLTIVKTLCFSLINLATNQIKMLYVLPDLEPPCITVILLSEADNISKTTLVDIWVLFAIL